MLVDRSVFNRIGLMDERYFIYWDDTDFCVRALRAGVKLVYLAEAKMYHKVSSLTGGGESPVSIRYLTRNHILFMRKNLASWQRMVLVPAYLFRMYWKWVRRDYGLKTLKMKQQAFVEGLRIPLDLATESTCIARCQNATRSTERHVTRA
jgi:GT2 family glycosyltransferase